VTIAQAVARPLLAGVFIYGGIDALRSASKKVGGAVRGAKKALTGSARDDDEDRPRSDRQLWGVSSLTIAFASHPTHSMNTKKPVGQRPNL
jgi:hypothetical protein